jgi:hypothetical protein
MVETWSRLREGCSGARGRRLHNGADGRNNQNPDDLRRTDVHRDNREGRSTRGPEAKRPLLPVAPSRVPRRTQTIAPVQAATAARDAPSGAAAAPVTPRASLPARVPIRAGRAVARARRHVPGTGATSASGRRADNICSYRAFRILTRFDRSRQRSNCVFRRSFLMGGTRRIGKSRSVAISSTSEAARHKPVCCTRA